MPDQNGKLNEKDGKKILQWLKDQIPEEPTCPMCKKIDWEPGQHLVSMRATNSESTLLGLDYPMILLACRSCGFTANLSARRVGIV